MSTADALDPRFVAARRAVLATVTPDGGPHLVPIVFAVEGDLIYTAVDHKPKRTTKLTRLANIAAEPRVSVLADHYDEDWQRLWWVRVDGRAAVHEDGEHAEAGRRALVAKYDQYGEKTPAGPFIAVNIERVRSWSAA